MRLVLADIYHLHGIFDQVVQAPLLLSKEPINRFRQFKKLYGVLLDSGSGTEILPEFFILTNHRCLHCCLGYSSDARAGGIGLLVKCYRVFSRLNTVFTTDSTTFIFAPLMKKKSVTRSQAYRITLYIAGDTPRSQAAIRNLKKLCAEQIPGKFELKIIDAAKHPELAIKNNLLALPMVVRTLPAPIRKMVGDLRVDDGSTIQIEFVDSKTK
jgi:circadian clock protein KaiB